MGSHLDKVGLRYRLKLRRLPLLRKSLIAMKKIGLLISLLIILGHVSNAQLNKYIIQLNDKSNNAFDISKPWEFLSERAIQRRLRYSIAIDSTDLPITGRYLDSIRLAGSVTILNASKWLNQVAIFTTDAAALAKISQFTFVRSGMVVAPRVPAVQHNIDKFSFEQPSAIVPQGRRVDHSQDLTANFEYGKSNGQVKIHQGDFLHNYGFRGEGMQISVLDGGFTNYLTLPTFDSIRSNNQILGTWDFVLNNSYVNDFLNHGMQCLSVIAANMPGVFVGTAPKASFYLYRTEDTETEYPIEEQNLAAALERADSAGVDMGSISLGYSTFTDPSFNYTYNNMDGNTTISARASDMAARKGMLIVVAAGNEGNTAWHYLVTPSDADSVLSVGAVDTLGNVGSFSSYGPSGDGQVKPGVAAVGTNAVIANANTGQPVSGSGTSFACPNMAGLSACLWQAFPEENNMGIISALQQSATRAGSPNDRVGYGIPDMKKAFVILLKRFYQQQIQQEGCATNLKLNIKSGSNMTVEVERQVEGEIDYSSIQTFTGTGDFKEETYVFKDDLSAFTAPLTIDYRIKMSIDGDTSFYFNPVTISHNNSCLSYTFIGSGNWSDPANWLNGVLPPLVLPAGSTIIINPDAMAESVLDVQQQIQKGGFINILPGKKLRIVGSLDIQ